MQQMLNRVPKVELSELHKGDAVMMVVTNSESDPTAITLLAGVESILSASPSDDRAAALLSQWSLGTPPAEAGQ